MADFLLEIRTEEIPAAALSQTRGQLADGFRAELDAAGFTGAAVAVASTSRRLVVQVSGVPERQPDRVETVTGPPASVAFDAEGRPTPAAEGFARKVGLEVGALERVATPKGEYVAAQVRQEGRTAAEILGDAVPSVVAALRFPKTMRWGTGQHVFVRPAHGVIALLDEEVVPLELFGIRAGRRTVGHRVHAPGEVLVPAPAAYRGELEHRKVILDPAVRLTALQERARVLAEEVGCRPHSDPELVAEHVELVEYPGLIRGEISGTYLELPREVVITTLRHHQKCLVLEHGDGGLAPYFLAVIDREDDPQGLIQQGNEWVIGARLADAAFFFAEDRKRPLAELVPGLERLEYHRTLGSLAAKSERVGRLACRLSELSGAVAEPQQLRRAAGLVKADLLTHMVGEFPELQGVMGGHYLRLDGEPEEVWIAARDHYLPHGFDGEVPASELGRLIAAADRLDTLAGLFAAGEIPSGSRDPFGLRRAAQALVRIVVAAGWNLDLASAVQYAVELAAEVVDGDLQDISRAVIEFLSERVRRYLTDAARVSGDTADAVMEAGWTRLPSLLARAAALEEVRAAPEVRALALAFKRVRNITDGQPEAAVDPVLLKEPAEADLQREATAFHDVLEKHVAAGRVEEAFAAMGDVAETLDRFFIEVLVMTEDERIRLNRIALLKGLGRDFLTLADLSKLQVEGGEK
ncbi:MAG: glycine--tRNA ligase subunit beta [Acidobacteria bacterium]|nr:glycine--tRNA ligase subunit beta [Acidobacteriota bacterium]